MWQRGKGHVQTMHLVERVYDAAVDPKAWSDFVEDLEAALGDVAVVLSTPHPSCGDLGEIYAPSLHPDFVRSYRKRFFALDPWTPALERTPSGSCGLDASAAPSEQELACSAFVREWLEPQGLLARRFLAAVIERDAELGTARISVFQRKGVRHGERARQQLNQLLPHLQRAVRIHFCKARLEAERRALGAALDRVPIGLILVDRRGHVHASNQASERILAERDGLELHREGVRATDAQQNQELYRLMKGASAAASAEAAEPETGLLLPRPSGRRPLEALVMGVRLGEAEDGRGQAMVAIFVSDSEQGMRPVPGLLRRLYSLTPSEIALANLLAEGHDLEESARELGVCVGTARQRLQQIFGKTDTRRQSMLVRLLLHGPAQLLSSDRD